MDLSDRAEEIAYELGRQDEPVSHSHLIDHTSVETVEESKEALRELLRERLLATVTGFKYKLANNEQAQKFQSETEE